MRCATLNKLAQYVSPIFLGALVVALMAYSAVSADDGFQGLSPQGDTDSVRSSFKKPSYSPYAGRDFPAQVYWGDTHVHTDHSLDAKGFGANIGPEEAFRFARGEEVVTSTEVSKVVAP
jgi:hypothetical protein